MVLSTFQWWYKQILILRWSKVASAHRVICPYPEFEILFFSAWSRDYWSVAFLLWPHGVCTMIPDWIIMGCALIPDSSF